MLQGHEQRFAKGEIILQQGSQGDRLYIVKSGTVMICQQGAEYRDPTPLAELGPGQMFGEMYLLSHEHTRNASAVAMSEVTAYVVFEDAVAHDFQHMSPFQKIMFREMGRRLNDMNESYLWRCFHPEAPSPEPVRALGGDRQSIKWQQDSAISSSGA